MGSAAGTDAMRDDPISRNKICRELLFGEMKCRAGETLLNKIEVMVWGWRSWGRTKIGSSCRWWDGKE